MPKNRGTHKKHKKHSGHKKKHHHRSDENIDSNIDVNEVDDFDAENGDDEEEYESDNDRRERPILADKTRERLKRKIVSWLDNDDKIKDLNLKLKKFKEAKKDQEEVIIKMITKLGMDDKKIDIHDENNNVRSRVYRHKSVTKGSLKEDIIKDALMEAIRDEKKVDQLVKKIESKRPINERYYLKRTKGNKE